MRLTWFLSLAAAGAANVHVAATTWYVDSSRLCGCDGMSWPQAFSNLQLALNVAQPDDEIRIAGFAPDNPLGRAYIPTAPASFVLRNRVTIEGGYRGVEGLPDHADDRPETYETVLSGDVDGDGILNSGNTDHVVVALDPAIDFQTVLDGVTITGGYADGEDDDDGNRGAGLFALDCSPTIRNCTFRDNAVEEDGLLSGGPALCARFQTGFTFDVDGRPNEWMLVEDCKIISNTAVRNGGGAMVYLDDDAKPGAIAFVRCEFSDNVARGEVPGDACGGALYIDHENSSADDWQVVDVLNSTFHKNYAPIAGGAISDKAHGRLKLTLTNCLLTENGVYPTPPGNPTVEGGAIGTGVGLALDVVNCTFSLNHAGTVGSALYWTDGFYDRVCRIRNSIFWGDVGPQEISNSGLDMIVDHSLVQGGGTGMGYAWTDSITDDPEFQAPGTGNFHLDDMSVANNAGLNDHLPLDRYDLDEDGITDAMGNSEPVPYDLDDTDRVKIEIVDMGAYEFVCGGDVNGDGETGFADILFALAQWGPCEACPPSCDGDIDGDCVVGFSEILAVLANWLCRNPSGLTLEQELAAHNLTTQDWNDYVNIMQTGTQEEKDNYQCWMSHYMFECASLTCPNPGCPDDDPFGYHPPNL